MLAETTTLQALGEPLGARILSGIVHELGGVLFVMRLRLESLERALPPVAREDVAALQRVRAQIEELVDALNLLRPHPHTTDSERLGPESWTLESWWKRVAPVVRFMLPRDAELKASLPAFPLTSVSPSGLAQSVVLLLGSLLSGGRPSPAGEVRAVEVDAVGDMRGGKLELRIRGRMAGEEHRNFGPASGLLSAARRVVRQQGGRVATYPGPTGPLFVLTLQCDAREAAMERA